MEPSELIETQNVDVDNIIANNSQLQNMIYVSADAISRLYSVVFMTRQLFIGKEHLPESAIVYGETVRQSVALIAKTYPDFEQFQFDVKATDEDLTIIGLNDFSNSVLGAIVATLQAPVIDHVTQDIPKPLPLLDTDYYDHTFDDDDDEEDDDYWDQESM